MRSRQMLTMELNYLDVDFRRSLLTSDPAQFAKELSERFYHVLFELTGFVDAIEWVTPEPSAGEEGPRTTLHHAYSPIAEFILAAIQMTQIFAVRLAILTLATPVSGYLPRSLSSKVWCAGMAAGKAHLSITMSRRQRFPW